ncbi:hypothetical protein [Arthrobacter psychrochitiniphilus]|uniref:Uncharacterized protein n=1 Tax=Arthrobacter psychrochitiniphilus TaxID=291045 RepID=A0A2V3DPG5_9MICC|nr:hypothetical protein [Arthrobacter psychrochitiniphilus]NYG18380.1 hypothetical protein [Arthrobacter psychrochitiniphilus]PXA64571.1 hypothetical protein CVS29_14650 [Arthrobacter psychrochitiniphilus]
MEQVDGSDGQWIADALERYLNKELWDQWIGTVATTIPDSFQAYARILHRVSGNTTTEVRWTDVAAAKGTTVHPAVQFHRLAQTELYGNAVLEGAPYGRPDQGELDQTQLVALAEILAGHTAAGQDVFQAVWVGWGSFAPGDGGIPDGAGERLRVAGGLREYWVFRGAMAELACPPWSEEEGGTHRETPNLAWPAGRSWCLATEIDFDSTLVGGSAELIAAVVNSPVLEALQVSPATNLSSEGDVINAPRQ